MRILAIDHGEKRMGVAISDELGIIAQPVGFLEAEPFDGLLEKLRDSVRQREVALILVGLPRNMDGSFGPAALKVQEFVAVLKGAFAIPVQTWDERLTTVEASRRLTQGGTRAKQQKGKVDAAAAAVLLQSYLDSRP